MKNIKIKNMKAKFPYGLQPFKSPESWGKKSKVSHMTIGEGEQKRLVGIKVETTEETLPFLLLIAEQILKE
jgi:hypothetical protein